MGKLTESEIAEMVKKSVNEAISSSSDNSNISKLRKLIREELKNVIHKEGNVWKIRGHKGKGDNEKDGDWKADYSSKEKAQNALKAYFANK